MDEKKSWMKLLTLFSMIAFVSHLIHIFVLWPDVPNHITIHFTNGVADNWGSKYFLLLMPVIGLVSWWIFGFLTKNPKKYNYINLTDANRGKQYKRAGNAMVIIQNMILFIFIFANESFLRTVIEVEDSIFFILYIVSLILICIIIFYNVIWVARLKK